MSVDADASPETPSTETEPEAATTSTAESQETDNPGNQRGSSNRWIRAMTYGVLPALALILALAAGYLKWCDGSARESRLAQGESVRAASDGATAMLSYKPDTVEADLGAARNRLIGGLKDSYSSLIHDVVIPGSKQKQITAVASVPAAASITESQNHAVVLVFVNQTITIGVDPPTETTSRVRTTLDKINDRWLISGFDPI